MLQMAKIGTGGGACNLADSRNTKGQSVSGRAHFGLFVCQNEGGMATC